MPYPAALKFLFLNQRTTRRYIPRREEGTSIPRIIHQTYRSQDALPGAIRDSISALRARNPGWEYRFYDDHAISKFIHEAYGPAVLSYFDRIDPRYTAARADLFRYLLIYHVGGVYLDIKSTVLPPLDELIKPTDRMLLVQWSQSERFVGAGRHDWDFEGKISGGELQQWHVIAAPGHPYVHAVIEAVLRNIDCYVPAMHGTGRNAVLRVSGPIAYTLAIAPLMPTKQHRFVAGHEDVGLEYSIYPDNTEHKRLFRSHYTDLTAPIVRPTLVSHSLSALYGAFDTFRQRRHQR